jgi:molecular chaperone Hsp33
MHDSSDALYPFQLTQAGVRGGIVRLRSAWSEIAARKEHPAAAVNLLGEALAASALFAGMLKFEGSLSIHLRHAGALRLLFAECTHDGQLRGVVRMEESDRHRSVDLGDAQAQLAITIENEKSQTRYQGLVAVESGPLSNAFEGYFERSEQLPSRIVLAVGNGVCAGILLQKIAQDPDRARIVDADAWNRVGHLLATLSRQELLDLPVQTLLLRLFHEEDVVLHAERPLRFECRCSRERVLRMLQSLGADEAIASLDSEGRASVTCEFCDRTYEVDRVDVAALFAQSPQAPDSSTAH